MEYLPGIDKAATFSTWEGYHAAQCPQQGSHRANSASRRRFSQQASRRPWTPGLAAREECEVTAPAARRLKGRIVYSGGGWYHPDFRGCSLSAILPRISRAYAFTRWNSDYTVTWVTDALIKKGVVARYGYTNVEWGVRFSSAGAVYYEGALVWMNRMQMLGDLA